MGQRRAPHPRRQERILWHGRPAWRSFAGRWTVVLWLVMLGESYPALQRGLLGVASLIVLSILLTRYRFAYTVTTQRVLERVGLLAKVVHEIRVRNINSIHLLQTPLERLLGVGVLKLQSFETEEGEVLFQRIASPETVRALIRRGQ